MTRSSWNPTRSLAALICLELACLSPWSTANAQTENMRRPLSVQLIQKTSLVESGHGDSLNLLNWPTNASFTFMQKDTKSSLPPLAHIRFRIGPLPADIAGVKLESKEESEDVKFAPNGLLIGQVTGLERHLVLSRKNGAPDLIVKLSFRDPSRRPLVDSVCTKSGLLLKSVRADRSAPETKTTRTPLIALSCRPLPDGKGMQIGVTTNSDSRWDSSTIPESAGKGERWKVFTLDPTVIRTKRQGFTEILGFQVIQGADRFSYVLGKSKDGRDGSGSGPNEDALPPPSSSSPPRKPFNATLSWQLGKLAYLIPTYDQIDASQALIEASIAFEPFSTPIAFDAGWGQTLFTLQSSTSDTPTRSSAFAAASYRFTFGDFEAIPGLGFALDNLSVPSANFSSSTAGPRGALQLRQRMKDGQSISAEARYVSLSNDTSKGSTLEFRFRYGTTLGSSHLLFGADMLSHQLTPDQANGEASAKGFGLSIGLAL